MTSLRPYTIARYGVYTAATVSLLSVGMGLRAGWALDYALLRSVFYFVVVAALGFGAEAVLLLTPMPPPALPSPPAPLSTSEPELENE